MTKPQLWRVDPTYPPGWRYKEAEVLGLSSILMSPCGQQFKSRLQAFLFLLRSRPSDGLALATMRRSLVLEGWEEHPNIPQGWLCKVSKRVISFITAEGFFLSSCTKAMEFMKNMGSYKSEDLESLKSLAIVHFADKNQWYRDDQLPKGWKFRLCSDSKRRIFREPGGQQFQYRRRAVEFMVKNGYSDDDISVMRESLVEEGWMKNNLLPDGWLYKTDQSGSITFLGKNGEIFRYVCYDLYQLFDHNNNTSTVTSHVFFSLHLYNFKSDKNENFSITHMISNQVIGSVVTEQE